MATAKEHITEIIKRQPNDSSYDDIREPHLRETILWAEAMKP